MKHPKSLVLRSVHLVGACTRTSSDQLRATQEEQRLSKLMVCVHSSHPKSDKYGKYWSMEEVHDMFAPPEETVDAVKEWLTSFGIHSSRIIHSDNKGWLAFDATVEEAENLLHTEFYEHEHMHSPNVRVGCDQ